MVVNKRRALGARRGGDPPRAAEASRRHTAEQGEQLRARWSRHRRRYLATSAQAASLANISPLTAPNKAPGSKTRALASQTAKR